MKEVSFEQLLENCLQDLARTDDVEASLQRHPQHADQLRPLLEMAQASRRYYRAVPEAPGGLVAGRERLLTLAAQQRNTGATATSRTTTIIGTRGRRIKLASPLKLIAAMLAVVLGVAVLTGGVAWAARNSLPGDLLYPVKLAAEDVRLALASAPGGQVNLALQLVEERGEEMRTLAADGRQIPDETLARMEQHIECALTRTAWATDEEINGLLIQIATRTRTQARLLEQAQAKASGQAQVGLERAAIICRRGAEAAEDGSKDPQTFRRRYRHRLGEPEPTSEPEQDQRPQEPRRQEQEGNGEGTPRVTPPGPQATPTPQGPGATAGPETTLPGPRETAPRQITPQGLRATATPHAARQGPEATATPQATPQGRGATATPQGSGATAEPHATQQGPGATATAQATPQGLGATAGPHATQQGPGATETPQGPGATSRPQATQQGPSPGATSQPGQPGSGQGGE